jgi:hypothetical protein
VVIESSTTSILLITIYSKTEQSDIKATELAGIVRQEEVS